MTSGYYLVVKKYLDQNKIDCSLPDYIQRGWNRIYTSEEKELMKQPFLIGPDVHIPNSTVRQRLGAKEILNKVTTETLRKVFELPDELLMNLSVEHKRPGTVEDDEEELRFQWDDDDDDDYEKKRKKSLISTIIDKQREKRRKYNEYKYDYDNLEPLSLEEIIEEIRTNIGKDLKSEDMKLIKELMNIISHHKNEQIMNIYDEFINIQLIQHYGGVPKLVQVLQEIQKVFEQVAMKTNVASIETIINQLLEKDSTYRVAVELSDSFKENTKKNIQQQHLNLINKSSDISEHDQMVFNMLINDRINRLSTSELNILIHDLETIRNIDMNKIDNNRDDQVKFVYDQLNLIFTRAHLDGIKTMFDTMKSSISISLREYIDKIENSLKMKLNEYDRIFIESFIHDHLTLLNDDELKIIYERLAQAGILKRLSSFGELNQSITMGLMKKIDTDGLGVVIENMKNIQLENDAMNKLIQALTHIHQYIQNKSSVPFEQIQKQLDMAYFIETRNLSQQDIHELAEAVKLYSIANLRLAEEATMDECSTFLEQLKAPFLRICIQRILSSVNEDKTIDLNNVSSKFYNEIIRDLFNELIHGSDDLNRNLLFQQIKEELKKNKELSDKLYRQMLKEKLIQIDAKTKIDTDKKKMSIILDGINQILTNKQDQRKQQQLLELFDRMNISVSERIKRWYNGELDASNVQLTPSRIKKTTNKRKVDAKTTVKVSRSKAKPTKPNISPSPDRPTKKSEQVTRKPQQKLPITTTVTSSKTADKQRKSVSQSRPKTQSVKHQEKKPSQTVNDTKETHNKNGKTKIKSKSRTPLTPKSEEKQKKTSDVPSDPPIIPPSTTGITEPFSADSTTKHPLETENDLTDHSSQVITSSPKLQESIVHTDTYAPERDDEQLADQHSQALEDTITEPDEQIQSSQDESINIDSNTETEVQKELDEAPSPSETIPEKQPEKSSASSSPHKTEIFQGNLETIRSKATTPGKIRENQLLNVEFRHAVAPLFYHSITPSNPKQEIHNSQIGQRPEFTDVLSYEKTKAQRILAKTKATNSTDQQIGKDTNGTTSSSTTLPISNDPTKPSGLSIDESSVPSSSNIKVSSKASNRSLHKSLKQTDDIYINSLTQALQNLFTQSTYDPIKLRKIHEELISSGHISPLNEFYHSSTDALRVILDHCPTYDELLKWTLALFQTTNKPNLIDFAHDLYSIAIDLELSLIDRIDSTKCISQIQENLKQQLQTLTENDLREINSYINASQLDKLLNISKKLHVASKDRMLSDLNSVLLHLIQSCHTFESKYRPMQIYIREISERFKSRAVSDLARKLDELEKSLSKTFGITFYGLSKRLNESRMERIK